MLKINLKDWFSEKNCDKHQEFPTSTFTISFVIGFKI